MDMDTKREWICPLLFLVVNVEAVLSLNCVFPIRACPSTMAEWNERERILNCTGKRYTCIVTKERILVEACMWNSKIMSGTVGCPYIAACDSTDGPILISEEKYFSCPETLDGCPNSNHTGYSISDMYKFSRCWITDKRTKLQTTTQLNQQMPTTLDHRQIYDEVKGYNHAALPTVLASAAAVVMIAVIFICMYIFIFKKRCSRNKGKYIKPDPKAGMNKV